MACVYVDTNILIYGSESSQNIYGKDISSSSATFFHETINCKHTVVISTWALEELSGLRKLDQTKMLITLIKKKTTFISHTQEELALAKTQAPDNFRDHLHGMLAIKAGASHLVTRNTDDFVAFADKLTISKPEHL